MYYISSKVSEGIYEVADTIDNSVEAVSAKDILKVAKKGIAIKGVSRTEEEFNIKVFNPEVDLVKLKFLNKDFEIEGTVLRKYYGSASTVEIPYVFLH